MNEILGTLGESALLAAIAFFALRRVRRIGAATRYAIWWMTLGAVLGLPLLPRPHAASAKTAMLISAQPMPAPPLEHYRHLTPVNPSIDDAIVVIPQPSSRLPKFLFAAWLAIFAIRLIEIARSYFHINRIKRFSTVWTRHLPARPRNLQLLLSSEASSPFAAGFLHPAIVLPATLPDRLDESEIDHVLLHEAAHIARRGDWMNLLGRLLAAALWFHPVALWILSRSSLPESWDAGR